jgi:flagellar basal-body rod modification protein FlgD
MTIDSINPVTSTSPAAGGGATGVGSGGPLTGSKDEFLKLFMAQLQHQNPLDPKSGADMVAQLATFSSVEQATKTNQYLSELTAAQAATSSAGLADLVGRDCSATAADFQLERGGSPPSIQLSSTSAMTGASVVITDDSGKEVRRLAVPARASSAQIAWDGNTGSGVAAPPGSYHITVEPGTTTGTITPQWHGRIDAVELTPAGARLRMGSLVLTPADIRTIGANQPIASSPLPVIASKEST